MAKDKVNWTFTADGHHHGAVHRTTDPVDGESVFATFGEARTELAAWFAYVAQEYLNRARSTRRIRKRDVSPELFNLTSPKEL